MSFTRYTPLACECSCGFAAQNLAQLEDHLDEHPDDDTDTHYEVARR